MLLLILSALQLLCSCGVVKCFRLLSLVSCALINSSNECILTSVRIYRRTYIRKAALFFFILHPTVPARGAAKGVTVRASAAALGRAPIEVSAHSSSIWSAAFCRERERVYIHTYIYIYVYMYNVMIYIYNIIVYNVMIYIYNIIVYIYIDR